MNNFDLFFILFTIFLKLMTTITRHIKLYIFLFHLILILVNISVIYNAILEFLCVKCNQCHLHEPNYCVILITMSFLLISVCFLAFGRIALLY